MNKIGYYSVGNKNFTNKNAALYESACSNQPVNWYFYEDVFNDFLNKNQSTLGLVKLNELYRRRAQHLRDNYDYLILNYSGGPDSHNILMTFLQNKIHLDEIYVQYSHSVDAKIYKPTNLIKGAENIHSEYDLVIKPVLDKLKISNPEIKITIHDIFDENIPKIEDETFLESGHFTGAFELIRQQQYSKTIDIMSDKGKKVADIFGIDKPLIIYKDKCVFTFFSDLAINVAGTKHKNKSSACAELFYWTPEMPEIALEQAYALYMHVRQNTSLLSLFDYNTIKPNDTYRTELIRKLTINLIYDTWDNTKFQVEKPVYFSEQGRSRDKYYLTHEEFKKYLEVYDYHASSWSSVIANQPSKVFYTNWFKIGYLNV